MPDPENERRKLEKAILALEAQRALLGDEVVEASIAGIWNEGCGDVAIGR